MPRAKTSKEDSVQPNATKIRQMDCVLDRVEESLHATQPQNEHKDKQMAIIGTRTGLICRQSPWSCVNTNRQSANCYTSRGVAFAALEKSTCHRVPLLTLQKRNPLSPILTFNQLN